MKRRLYISSLFLVGLMASCFLPPPPPIFSQVSFPNANTGQQAQNNVAGCNANIPVAACQGGSSSNTTSSVTISSGVVTIPLVTAMATAFPVNSYACLSGATTVTQLNGLMLKFNNSTTTSTLVGTLVNTQNATVTPTNISSTAETNLYVQGPGYSPCYLAPFPAPNTYACGTAGNGSPTCSTGGSPTGANTYVLGDWSIANPNGGPPALPINMMIDLASNSSKPMFCGLTGETNDNCVSLEDGLALPGQFYIIQQGQHQFVSHGHWNPAGCGGQPCFINDLPSSANWYSPFAGGYVCGFQRNLSKRPGANQAIMFCWLFGNSGGGAGSNFEPLLEKCTVTYNGTGTPVTGSCAQIYDIGMCAGWGHVSLGSGADCQGTGSCLGTSLAAEGQESVDNFDDKIQLVLGAGSQGTLNRNAMIVVSLAQNKCEIYDSAGNSGDNLGEVDFTPGSQGTGFNVGDTVTATSGSCTFTETVTQTSSGKVLQLLSVNTTTSSAITGTGLGQIFTVASDAGMYVGQTIYLDTGANLDNATITSCGTSTLHASCTSTSITATVNKTHVSGSRVVSQSINNNGSGCAHTFNITPTSTSGSGNIGTGGLRLDIEQAGDPTTGTIWPFTSPCTLGTTTSPSCATPIVPITDTTDNLGQAPYGAHSANCERSGRYCFMSGYEVTWQGKNGIPGGDLDTSTPTLFGGTNTTGAFSGHPSIGYLFDGAANYPNYYSLRFADGGNCATPPPNLPQCSRIFQFPSACTSNPGASQSHSSNVSIDNGQGYPFYLSTTFNNGGFPGTMVDPPGWTCGYMSKFFTVFQTGATGLFSSWYENYNNNGENFQCSSDIWGMDPHGKFVLATSDMYNGFTGNTGLGTDNASQPFCGLFAYTTGINGAPPNGAAATIIGTISGIVLIQ